MVSGMFPGVAAEGRTNLPTAVLASTDGYDLFETPSAAGYSVPPLWGRFWTPVCAIPPRLLLTMLAMASGGATPTRRGLPRAGRRADMDGELHRRRPGGHATA
jgi:hypothetical protein